MKQLLKIAAAPAAADVRVGLGCDGDTGRREPGLRVCSFATMEQCQAAVSGRNGVCARDPFLPNNSSAFAYQPKHPLRRASGILL